jgi:hypothetical protein
MNKNVFLKITLCLIISLFLFCGHNAPLLQFQDIQKQTLHKNRLSFQNDIDITPILALEDVSAQKITSVKTYGKMYVVAEGFKNLYCVLPKNTKEMKLKVIKLKRKNILPFQNPEMEWTENDQIIFKWTDSEGVHENVIDSKGKARFPN